MGSAWKRHKSAARTSIYDGYRQSIEVWSLSLSKFAGQFGERMEEYASESTQMAQQCCLPS
jgi:hypothetical protein